MSIKLWESEPGKGGKLWNELKDRGFLGFGWYGFLEDLRDVKPQFFKKLKETFGEEAERTYRILLKELKKGDVVFIREKNSDFLFGVGVVASDYTREEIHGAKLHGRYLKPLVTIEKKVKYSFGKLPIEPVKNPKSLLEAVKDLVPKALELYISDKIDLGLLSSLISREIPKNLVLYGPPGTGKTHFMLKELPKIFKSYEVVAFHPSFSYEDFVEGWRPSKGGFEVRDGILKAFVKRIVKESTGLDHPEIYNLSKEERKKLFQESPPYGLLIDELNRGNASAIFGELITLLDEDKRLGGVNEVVVRLPYSREPFGLPPNLYVVATMNTVDKSIANIDAALRRRFYFKEMRPDYSLLRETLNKRGFKNGVVDGIDVPRLLESINMRLEELLDRDHVLGHSYFLDVSSFEDIVDVLRGKVIPLLGEFFFDDWEKVQFVLKDIDEKGKPLEPQIIRRKGKSFWVSDRIEENALKKLCR